MDREDLLDFLSGSFTKDEQLVAAFQVKKSDGKDPKKAIKGQDASRKGRWLVLTLKRDPQTKNLHTWMHLLKLDDDNQKVKGRKLIQLSSVKRLTVSMETIFEIKFENNTKEMYQCNKQQELLDVVAVIYFLCSQFERKQPSLQGIDSESLENIWYSRRDSVVLDARVLGKSVQKVTANKKSQEEGFSDVIHQKRDTILSKEEENLKELLEAYQMQISNIEEFSNKLDQECYALEEANIYTFLFSSPMVESVIDKISKSLDIIGNLQDSLRVYDSKLQHLKVDCGAIEQRSNTLEIQASNNRKLQQLLLQLLDYLKDKQEAEDMLTSKRYKSDSLDAVQAAWTLHDTLEEIQKFSRAESLEIQDQDLQDPIISLMGSQNLFISPQLLEMRAIIDRSALWKQLLNSFCAKNLKFCDQEIERLVKDVEKNNTNYLQQAQTKGNFNHQSIYNGLTRSSQVLIKVCTTLDKNAISQSAFLYANRINNLIKQDVLAFITEIQWTQNKKGLQQNMEPDIFSSQDKRTLRSALNIGEGDTAQNDVERVSSISSLSQQSNIRMNNGSFGNEQNSLHNYFKLLIIAFIQTSLKNIHFMIEFFLMYDKDIQQAIVDKYEQLRLTMTATLNNTENEKLKEEFMDEITSYRYGDHLSKVFNSTQYTISSSFHFGVGLSLEVASDQQQCQPLLDVIMNGVTKDMSKLVDLVNKDGNQILCLPMILILLRWMDFLQGHPLGAPIRQQLMQLLSSLKTYLDQFVATRVSLVDKYSQNFQQIKAVHILPFFQNFPLFAERIEYLYNYYCTCELGDLTLDLQDVEGRRSSSQNTRSSESSRRLSEGPYQINSLSKKAKAPNKAMRRIIDSMYAKILTQMFASLQRIVGQDLTLAQQNNQDSSVVKYGERLKLENLTYFVNNMQKPAFNSASTELQYYTDQAEQQKTQALTTYVIQQLKFQKFWGFLEFGDRLRKKLKDVNRNDIQHHQGYTQQELQKLIVESQTDIQQKIESIFQRLVKQFGMSKGSILSEVWQAIQFEFQQRWTNMETLLRQCYPGQAQQVVPYRQIEQYFFKIQQQLGV